MLESHTGAPAADWRSLDPLARTLVPDWYARQHRVYPLSFNNFVLVVATADPGNLQVESELAFAAGRRIEFHVAAEADIEAAWAGGEMSFDAGPAREVAVREATDEAANLPPGGDAGRTVATGGPEPALAPPPVPPSAPPPVVPAEPAASWPGSPVAKPAAEDESPKSGMDGVGDDAPVAQLVFRLLEESLSKRASDLHLEPHEEGGVARIRVDGVLQKIAAFPPSLYVRVVSRLKILGELDIADRLRPQDGRASHRRSDGSTVSMRVSVVPTRYGEKMVLRFLAGGAARSLEELGLLERELDACQRLIDKRDGLIILTGPTGSGKTTTLYSLLSRLDSSQLNICTVEDPVEYILSSATQVQVNKSRGVTFASALRAFLRQDPDVILVGEVRDAETASVSLQAASTGHLVLTTLHTNDAFGVLPRLSDLEIDHTVLADALRGIVAQRLLRRVCGRCARTIAPDDALTEAQHALSVRYGVRPTLASVGCDQCSGTGFRGRMVAAEVIEVTGEVAQAVRASAPLDVIRAAARRAGTRSMLDIALELVARGDTTLDEVHRVLGDTDTAPSRAAEPDPPAAVTPSEVPIIEVLPIPDDVGRGHPASPRGAPPELRAPIGAPILTRSLTSHWTGLGVGVAKPSVLIADQDVDDLFAFEAHLSGRGWRVTTAVDGEEARRFLMGEAFSLAVLRLRLPKISGRDLLQRISAQGRTATPIVLITNLALDPNAERTLGEGAADFIHKPVTPAELERRCLAVLLRRSGEG